ncbi:MAG: amino acid permease [Myxococcales bacterium]|nr:amino acid permease [Myxococcales bacterium]
MSGARPLRTAHVAAVVVGAIIGVGIFFTPASLARTLPSPAWLFAVWLLGAATAAAGALVFAELGGRYPHAGGLYVFLREGFGAGRGAAGRPLAFLFGFVQLFVVQPGSMAIIALVLMQNVAYLGGALPPGAESAGAVGAIVLFTLANLLGLRTGGRIQLAVAALKLAALAFVIAIGLGWGSAGRILEPLVAPLVAPLAPAAPAAPAALAAPAAFTVGDLGTWFVLGMVPVLFTFGGWQHGTYIAGSVDHAERSVPRGILLGVAAVLVAYLAVNVAYLALLGQPGLARSESPAADAVAVALGPVAGKVVAAAIVVSAAGILNTVCLGFPFVLHAMAKDGLFFARAAELHPRTGRPALAVAIQGAWACLAVLLGASRIDVLLVGVAFVDWAFNAAVALVHLRVRRRAAAPGVLRAPAVAAWVFLAVSVAVTVGCLVRAPLESAYGAGVVVLGVGAWVGWGRRGQGGGGARTVTTGGPEAR